MTNPDTPIIVGYDVDGHQIAKSTIGAEAMLYPLTPCCHASGKGSIDSETGIVCRSCYEAVDPKFGDVYTEADIVEQDVKHDDRDEAYWKALDLGRELA